MKKKQIIPDGTIVKFGGYTLNEWSDEEIMSSFKNADGGRAMGNDKKITIKDLKARIGKKVKCELETYSELGNLEYEYYNITFSDGLTIYGVNGDCIMKPIMESNKTKAIIKLIEKYSNKKVVLKENYRDVKDNLEIYNRFSNRKKKLILNNINDLYNLSIQDLNDYFLKNTKDIKYKDVASTFDSDIEDAIDDGYGRARIGNRFTESYLTEGTWSVPNTEEKAGKLMSYLTNLKYNGGVLNTNKLNRLVGDDSLFDQLDDINQSFSHEVIVTIQGHIKNTLKLYKTNPENFKDKFSPRALEILTDIAKGNIYPVTYYKS